jgi:hypothetical protein
VVSRHPASRIRCRASSTSWLAGTVVRINHCSRTSRRDSDLTARTAEGRGRRHPDSGGLRDQLWLSAEIGPSSRSTGRWAGICGLNPMRCNNNDTPRRGSGPGTTLRSDRRCGPDRAGHRKGGTDSESLSTPTPAHRRPATAAATHPRRYAIPIRYRYLLDELRRRLQPDRLMRKTATTRGLHIRATRI